VAPQFKPLLLPGSLPRVGALSLNPIRLKLAIFIGDRIWLPLFPLKELWLSVVQNYTSLKGLVLGV